MKALSRMGVAIALSVCIAGCTTPGPPAVPTAVVTPLQAKVIAPDRAKNAVAIGKSTKADVIAALGETLVISFDSGFEVWVYRLGRDTTAEFVVLFAPTGLVAKTRIRPAPSRP